MARLPLLRHEAAPETVRSLYEEFYRRMQFPAAPNFITIQGHSDAATRGIWEMIKNVLLGGRLPRWKKELMIVAISRERNCQYCIAAHSACCRMLGVGAELMVRDVSKLPNKELRKMIQFAIKAACDPQGMAQSDFKSLREEGLDDGEIIEIISTAGLAVQLNIIADTTAVEPDEMMKG